jgi:mannosyltransferase
MAQVEVIAPNFKRRLSGVTSTIIQLIPLQAEAIRIATLGPGLPDGLPKMRWSQLPRLFRRPARRPFRIWHARRNTEMLGGLVLKALGAPLRLIFTSAAQRDHTAYTKWLLRRMDGVIATSAGSAAFLEVPHTVIRHGVDLDSFHPPRDEDDLFSGSNLKGKHAVGCFGRVRHQKGTDLFVEAMIELLPRFPDWTAVITGRVTPEHKSFGDALKARVEAAGLGHRIHFLGEVPDIKVWYRRLSLYVAPSRNEGFGLTPLEAMASQTAVVASDAGAYAEMIVPGETGAVVPAGDGEALTRAIAAYLADPALAKRHGENALARVRQEFPLQRESAGILSVYEDVFAGRRPGIAK